MMKSMAFLERIVITNHQRGSLEISYSLRFENARRITEMNSNFQISGGCRWTVIRKIVVKLKGGVVLI